MILGPSVPFVIGNHSSPAHKTCREILVRRGNSPRLYRNMLLFLVADRERLQDLEHAVRDWIAWTSIVSFQNLWDKIG